MSIPLTPDDLTRFALPTELVLAPDGHLLAVTVTAQAENAKYSLIALIDGRASTIAPRFLSSGHHLDRHPAWSPDGDWLAFTSNRADGNQIWIMPLAGGEPRQVTRLRHDASRPRWSPDGHTLVFQAEVRDESTPLLAGDAQKPESSPEATERIRQVTRLQYRSDGSDIAEGRTHLWCVDVAGLMRAEMPTARELPTPRQITFGDFDHSAAAWSPDGTRLVFISDRAADRDANITEDVWLLTLATGEIVRLSTGESEVSRPAWSPDGQMIAWYAMPTSTQHSIDNTHIAVVAFGSDGQWSSPRDILAGLDMTVGSALRMDLASFEVNAPTWSPDGRGVYAPVNERGTVPLWWFPAAAGAPYRVTAGALQIGPFAALPEGDRIVAIVNAPEHPPEVASFDLRIDGPSTQPTSYLSDLNPWLAERYRGIPEHFDFFTEDNWWLEGWILWPPNDTASSHEHRHPVILDIHGGPHGFFGPAYFARHQVFAGAGYAVVFVNPRGSVGYGAHFAQACDRDWGGADYHDLLAGLDAALARGRLDAQRMAVTGVSYGGYMTNWIIGHTRRFKAAVTVNSVANLISCFGTGDIDATFGIPEYGGTPWERMGYYIERSPITHAPAITTPTRIIGAERDWRCPISQSEEFFTALAFLRHAPVDFLRVPGVSHNINTGSPRQRVAWLRAILEWIEQYNPVATISADTGVIDGSAPYAR